MASVLWYNFSEVGTTSSKRLNAYSEIGGKVLSALTYLLLAYIWLLLPTTYATQLYKFQTSAALAGFLACYMIIRPHLFSTDHITFFSFGIISITLLLSSTNLIIIFFTLELINMIVIYSFFFNTNMGRQLSIMSASKISASCIYQFILNFFSSIVLYLAINWYIALAGGADLAGVTLWQTYHNSKYPLTLLLSAFLLKFGSGPWIFIKISIYRNLNYIAVFLYSVIYLLAMFIFFLNLMFVLGIEPTAASIYVILALSISGVLAFSTLAFQSPNVFVFLSFSSLINITVFLLQALSSVVFK